MTSPFGCAGRDLSSAESYVTLVQISNSKRLQMVSIPKRIRSVEERKQDW